MAIRVPDHSEIIRTKQALPLEDETKAILKAINAPINSKKLTDMISTGDKVVVTHSDITRATPNERILPVILNEIERIGVKRDDITLINALGTHRKQSKDELRNLLGGYIVGNYNCIQHNAFDDDQLVDVGKSSFGNRIRLNKCLLEADLKIFTGFIEPHFFAGFSGGPKAVLPALAGSESVMTNHGYKMISHPKATFNITEGNPIWDEMREASEKVENTFLVNVTLDPSKNITGVFAGDVISAHKVGCQFVREHSLIAIEEPYDIVITTNSGYPLDQNLYQSIKGLSGAARAVRKGGAIIMCTRCEDGIPNHGSYGSLLKRAGSPGNIIRMISQPGFQEQDSWEVQVQAYAQLRAEVHIYSDGLSDTQIRDALFIPCRDIEQTLDQLINKFGKKICVIPEGPLVIIDHHKYMSDEELKN